MKIAIIGAGNIAQVHGPAILKQDGCTLAAIADKDIARAESLAGQLQVASFYSDAAAMIDEQKPDIVHVLTSPQYHADVGIMAMNKGCHALVEKPMALSLADAQRMIEAAGRNKVKLCVNHNMVFEDTVRRAIETVSRGNIGEVVSVEAHYAFNARRAPAMIEEGAEYCHWAYKLNGGPLQDHMAHMASLVFEFLPGIRGVSFEQLHRGVLRGDWPDEIRAVVKSDRGTGFISISMSERPDVITLTVKGTKGAVQANLFTGIMTCQKESIMPRAVSRGLSGFGLSWQQCKGACRNIFKFAAGRVDKSNGVNELVNRFYRAVREDTECPVSTDKILRVTELMERIWPSPVVKVSKPAVRTARTTTGPTALVTGASGFVGSYLVERLVGEKVNVRALVRPNSIHAGRLLNLDVETVTGDLSDPEAVRCATAGVDVIYHLGASMTNNWHDHEQATIKGTENVIRAAAENKVSRLLHVSTPAVYDLLAARSNSRIKEDFPYQRNARKMGPYAFAKIEAEKKVLAAHQQHGLPVTIVRLGMVIGPKGRVFFPHFGYHLQDKVFLVIGNGKNVMPFTYIDNTIDGILKASRVPKAVGQIYNLVDEANFSINDYLRLFAKTTGIPARIIHLPYLLPYFLSLGYEIAASLGIVKRGVTSRAQLKWKCKRVFIDAAKAKTELGWTPAVPFQEGLVRTFSWYAKEFAS